MASTCDVGVLRCVTGSKTMCVFLSVLFISLCYGQNLNSPSFGVQPKTFTVSELAAVGDDVFRCQATDDDTGLAATLRFSIVGGNGSSSFSVDNNTCDVTVAQQLDYETAAEYDVIIEVKDLDPVSPRSATGTFTVQVLDANENAPVFTHNTTETIFVSEDTGTGVLLFQCVATDSDSAVISYSIQEGNVDNAFSLTSDLCKVTLTSQLDYETTTSYTLKLIADDLDPDNPLTSSMTLSIWVTDVNEYPPVFTNVPVSPVAVTEDAATGTTILTCSVSDGDSDSSPSGQHIFSITAGNIGNKFSLDNGTCLLTIAGGLDFESRSRYDLTIEASDLDPTAPRSASQVFSVEVEDVNERPTMLNLPGSPVFVWENVTTGTVIFTCSALDPDLPSLPRAHLTYKIMGGNEAGLFSVDGNTCAVSVTGSLDFESVEQHELTLRAQDDDPVDRMSVARPLVISVLDVNEHTPAFVNVPTTAAEIGEHSSVGTTVFTCTATDGDSSTQPSGQLRFQITGGNEDGIFSVQDDSVCQVTLANTVDFETRSSYSLTMTVHDLDPVVTFSSTQLFQVNVLDENDQPKLQSVASMPTVAENSAADTLMFECLATDQDSSSLLSGQLSYAIVSGNTDDAFTLTPPCRIQTSRPLDHETQVLYDLEIRVTDLDPTDPKTDTQVYTVKIADVNDNTPYFIDVPSMPINLPEDTPVGLSFMNCSGDDDDTPLELTGHVMYEIIGGNDENFFSINTTTCDMQLLKSLDYETKTLGFNLTIRIYDLDPVAPRSVEQDYRFCVTNVNDNAPQWVEILPKKMKIMENSPLGMYLGKCSATDGDTPLHPSGHVRYEIKGGNKYGLFYLDPYSCDLYINGLIDYESRKHHSLKIIAYDLDPDTPLESSVMKVKVSVIDENDMGPSCETSVMTVEVTEATAAKSVVMTMNCDDVDAGSNGALRFQALDRSTALKVSKMGGKITLLKKQDWDDASMPREYDLRVRIRDNGSPANIATATVRVVITDADDIKPVFQKSAYDEVIPEDLPRGSTVLRVSATDGDQPDTPASTVTYGLLSTPRPDWFLLNPYTGDIVVKRAMNADDFLQVDLKVFAYSSDLSDKRSKVDVVVYLEDVNNVGPKFVEDVYHVSVQEATSYSAPILTVEAPDTDWGIDGVVRYSIENGPMEIDSVTGEIRVNSTFDFEDERFYNVTATAYDMFTPSLTATASIVLTVEPENEFDPVWTSGTDFTVSEDTLPGTVVFQLNATDEDSGWDGELVYWSSLSTDVPFLVDQAGRVLLAAPLDYRVVNAYTVPVTATDRSRELLSRRSVTAALHVTVTDVNDLSPVCRPVPVAVDVYPWIGFTIASLDCAEDADTVNGLMSYRIAGGDPGGVFQVDAGSGELSAAAKPTHEQYELSVEVSDGGTPPMTSFVSVVILVEPELTLTNLPATIDVTEDAAVGTVVFSTGACCSFTTPEFELLSGNEDSIFYLNTVSGDVILVRHLDREVTSQHVLVLGVGDQRGQTATATLSINVVDVNDNAPTFYPVFTFLKVGESLAVRSSLGQWTAVDRDEGINATLTYSLLDTLTGRFSVDTSSGIVTLEKQLDFETDRSFIIQLIATDGGAEHLSATATIQVEVVNADEYPPQFLTGSGTITVSETFPPGLVLFVLQASDDDLPDVIGYTLTDTDLPFLVLPDSGEVVLQSRLDREAMAAYQLHFEAVSDKGDTAVLAVEVQVEDADDNDPVFSSSVYEFQVPHGTTANVTVGQVTVTDDDIGGNADFTVRIVSGNGAGYFTVEGVTVKTAKTVSYGETREFILTLRAHRVGGASDIYRHTEAAVRIEVLPATALPKFANSTKTVTVEENTAVNTVLCDLDGTAFGATEGENGTLRYVIRAGNDQGLFSVDEDTGVLRVAAHIDYEAQSSHTLAVDGQNRDDAGVKDSVTVTVNVINLNDNAPRPASAVFSFLVDEDVLPGTSLGSVVFSDDDAGVFGDFSLVLSGCDSSFVIDPDTGEMSVKQKLNYNDASTHACLVTATDAGSPARSGVASVVVSIRDVNDHEPQFQGTPYMFNVYEHTLPDATLAVFLAVDSDSDEGGEVTYSLLSGNSGNAFTLNETTGAFVLNADLDATLIPQFVLEMQAADGGAVPLTSTTNVIVNVVDVNDHAPIFTVAGTLDVAVDRAAAPGSELFVFNATDDDVGDNALIMYAITAGNAEGLFFVGSSSGQLTTRASLLDAPDTLTLTVTAFDHGTPPHSASIPITVFISPPLASSVSTPSLQVLSVAVAEDVVQDTVVATLDPSPAALATAYVIVSGNYEVSFDVSLQADGTGQLRVVKTLDYEVYRAFELLVNVETAGGGDIQRLVLVNVTDVNDNAPEFDDGPSLVLFVAENTPVGHTLWSLTAHDADDPVTNGELLYEVESATAAGMLSVSSQGDIVLLASPDYEALQQMEAVITVRDDGNTPLSSSIFVTLHVIDVDERQLVQVTSAATTYISTEIPFNTNQGQIVHQLSAAEFSLTTTPTSTVTFLTLAANGAFAISATSGEVTVSSPQQLADNSAYFQWVVCKVREDDGSTNSELAMLRIDTYDKYKNLVAIQTSLDVSDLEANKAVMESKLQALFSSRQRVGIYSVIAQGDTARRRRLLAAESLALIYVVQDVSADQLQNVMTTKLFLTQQQILQVLQLSSDGSPVAALTVDPLPADLVMPYQTGSTDHTTFADTDHFPIIIAIICILILIIIVFVIACVVYKAKQKRKWNVHKSFGADGKRKTNPIHTPAPAFFIRKDSLFPDDVSSGSTTSLLDDDSGMGDSVGSRSLARKSPSPSSGSNISCGNEIGCDEIALSARSLLSGSLGSVSRRDTAESDSSSVPVRRGQQSRYTWNKEKAGLADGTWSCSYPKPPLSWLPPLPGDRRRGSGQMWFESPYGYARYGRRGSGLNSDGYIPSALDGTGSRRVTGRWDSEEESLYRTSRRSSQVSLTSRRRSTAASVATAVSDRPHWRATSIYPNFDPSPYASYGSPASFVSPSAPDRSGGATASWLRTTDETPDRLDRVRTKEPTPTHQVTWKPKRNPAKGIFHEKLVWNAVSTIPKPVPLPRQAVLAKDPVNASWAKSLSSRRKKPSLPLIGVTETKRILPEPEETTKEASKVSEQEREVLDSIFGAVSARRMSTYKSSPFSSVFI